MHLIHVMHLVFMQQSVDDMEVTECHVLVGEISAITHVEYSHELYAEV